METTPSPFWLGPLAQVNGEAWHYRPMRTAEPSPEVLRQEHTAGLATAALQLNISTPLDRSTGPGLFPSTSLLHDTGIILPCGRFPGKPFLRCWDRYGIVTGIMDRWLDCPLLNTPPARGSIVFSIRALAFQPQAATVRHASLTRLHTDGI